MKRWWEPKTVKLCLAVIAGAALGYVNNEMTGAQALATAVFGLFGIFSRLGTLKLENILSQKAQGQDQDPAAEAPGPS